MNRKRRNYNDFLEPKKKLFKSSTGGKVLPNCIGVWRFGEGDVFTSVPKTWSVAQCISSLRKKLKEDGDDTGQDLDLWVKNRCIILDKKKLLSDYPGLAKLYLIRRPESRDAPHRYRTSKRDVTDPYSDDTCVIMTCSHAISPDNLYAYAWNKINNGAIDVTCPAIPDVSRPSEQCAHLWNFKDISIRACLSNDEINLFLSKMFSNWLEKQKNVYLCPNCDEAQQDTCDRSVIKCRYCKHSFCVKCQGPVGFAQNICTNSECQQSLPNVRNLLRNCSMRTLVDVPNCPSVRACPVCSCVIEFDEEDSCKHMSCPRNTCQAKFCFICLKVKTDTYYWPCGGAYEQCDPAKRQIV
ncbi:E3 ubiquitin-protein ligase RNF19A-like [Mizuhopecten yessoensis]|nr:E3 ubiquitin-protein ligase RNF19A-like [Mizuhopecten yessoensis]